MSLAMRQMSAGRGDEPPPTPLNHPPPLSKPPPPQEYGDQYLQPVQSPRVTDNNANYPKGRNSKIDSGISDMGDAQVQLLDNGETVFFNGPPTSPGLPTSPGATSLAALEGYVPLNGYLPVSRLPPASAPHPRTHSVASAGHRGSQLGLQQQRGSQAALQQQRGSQMALQTQPSLPATPPAMTHTGSVPVDIGQLRLAHAQSVTFNDNEAGSPRSPSSPPHFSVGEQSAADSGFFASQTSQSADGYHGNRGRPVRPLTMVPQKQHVYEELPAVPSENDYVPHFPPVSGPGGPYYSEPRDVGPRVHTPSTPHLNKTVSAASNQSQVSAVSAASATTTGSEEGLWPATPRSGSTTYRRKKSTNPLYEAGRDLLKNKDGGKGGHICRCACVGIVLLVLATVAALVLGTYVLVRGQASKTAYLVTSQGNESIIPKLETLQQQYNDLLQKYNKLEGEQLKLRALVTNKSKPPSDVTEPPQTTAAMRDSRVDALQSALTRTDNEVQAIRADVVSLRQTNHTLSSRLDHLAHEVSRARTAEASQNASLSSQSSELAQYGLKFNALNSKVTGQEQAMTTQFRQVNSKLTFVNSTLSRRMDNVTKMPGPPGPAGVGDLSNCKTMKKEHHVDLRNGPVSEREVNYTPWFPANTDAEFIHRWVIMGITCTTEAGLYSYLNERQDTQVIRDPPLTQYRCQCKGALQNSNIRYCKLYVWACPKFTKN